MHRAAGGLHGGTFGYHEAWGERCEVGLFAHVEVYFVFCIEHLLQRVVLAEKHCFGVVYMYVCLLNVTLGVERLVLETRCERGR